MRLAERAADTGGNVLIDSQRSQLIRPTSAGAQVSDFHSMTLSWATPDEAASTFAEVFATAQPAQTAQTV